MYESEQPTADDFLRQVGKLQQLTLLKLDGITITGNMQLLPTQLQQLNLIHKYFCQNDIIGESESEPSESSESQSHSGSDTASGMEDFMESDDESDVASDDDDAGDGVVPPAKKGTVVTLQHLTALRQLQLDTGILPAGSSMPPNLGSLELTTQSPPVGLADIGSLQHVTSLVLDTYDITSADVEALKQWPQLQDLSISVSMENVAELLEVAAVWHGLPLQTLCIGVPNYFMTHGEVQQLFRHIGTATQLTRLWLGIEQTIQPPEVTGAAQLAFFKHFKGLQRLQSLELFLHQPQTGRFVLQDAQHLSALVRLTCLALWTTRNPLCTAAETVHILAANLTTLRRLVILSSEDCDSLSEASTAALAEIGRLRDPEELRLGILLPADAERCLQMLTGLSRLTRLQGFQAASKEALQAFCAAIQQQRQTLSTAKPVLYVDSDSDSE